MNTKFKLLALAMVTGFAVNNAQAVTGDAAAEIVADITIVQTTALQFGKMSAGTGGTVALTAAGVRSVASGTVTLVAGTTPSQGIFDVDGTANATYAITLPGAAILLTRVAGTETMSVGTFVSNPTPTGTLDGTGTQNVNVGATLTVSNAQVAGVYQGTYAVTVAYN